MSGRTLVRGGIVLRRRGERYAAEPADVVVRGEMIEDVVDGGGVDPSGFERVVDAESGLVIPGLVNAHTHSYGNLVRGTFDGLPLEAWMPYATAVTVGRTAREAYVSAMLGCAELIRSGVTTVLDHLGGDADTHRGALQAYQDAGLRVAFAPMVSDLAAHRTVPLDHGSLPADLLRRLERVPVPDHAAVTGQLRALLEEWHGRAGRVTVLVGPSGPQRCSEELLRSCRDLAEEFDTGFHTHLLETRAQRVMAERAYGRSMVAYLDDLGVLSSRFSGAHAVWCTEEDLRRLAERGAHLVHNPWSNLTIGSGVAPLASWRRSGVGRALGTDGANCGCNQSVLRAMNLSVALHRVSGEPPEHWTRPDEVLRMATEGGADALQLAGQVGRVEAGYQADLVVIGLDSPAFVPLHDPVNQLVFGETDRGVETVLIAGRVVLDQGRIATFEERAVLDEARGMAEEIMERNAELLDLADAQRPYLLGIDSSLRRASFADPTRAFPSDEGR